MTSQARNNRQQDAWLGVTQCFPVGCSCPAFNLSAVNFIQSSLGYTLHFEMAQFLPHSTLPSSLYNRKDPESSVRKQNTNRLFWYNINCKHGSRLWVLQHLFSFSFWLNAVQWNDSRNADDRGRFIIRMSLTDSKSGTTQKNYTHAHTCTSPGARAHTHTEICNTYCISTVAMVSRTRLDVTLYV
jgi:hypothetical protein